MAFSYMYTLMYVWTYACLLIIYKFYIYIYKQQSQCRRSHLKQYFTWSVISNLIAEELSRRYSELILAELNARRNSSQIIVMMKMWSNSLFPQSLRTNLLLDYVLILWRYPMEKIVITGEKFCAPKQHTPSFAYLYTREKDCYSQHLWLQL